MTSDLPNNTDNANYSQEKLAKSSDLIGYQSQPEISLSDSSSSNVLVNNIYLKSSIMNDTNHSDYCSYERNMGKDTDCNDGNLIFRYLKEFVIETQIETQIEHNNISEIMNRCISTRPEHNNNISEIMNGDKRTIDPRPRSTSPSYFQSSLRSTSPTFVPRRIVRFSQCNQVIGTRLSRSSDTIPPSDEYTTNSHKTEIPENVMDSFKNNPSDYITKYLIFTSNINPLESSIRLKFPVEISIAHSCYLIPDNFDFIEKYTAGQLFSSQPVNLRFEKELVDQLPKDIQTWILNRPFPLQWPLIQAIPPDLYLYDKQTQRYSQLAGVSFLQLAIYLVHCLKTFFNYVSQIPSDVYFYVIHKSVVQLKKINNDYLPIFK